jgi:O-antigen/teichoic acid export membrane protein
LVAIAYAISAVVIIILCITLVPLLGPIGAGIALVSQSATVLVLIFIMGNRIISIPLRKGFGFRWCISIVSLLASFFVLSSLLLPDIVTYGGSCIVYLLVLNLSGILTIKDLKQIIRLATGRQISSTDL